MHIRTLAAHYARLVRTATHCTQLTTRSKSARQHQSRPVPDHGTAHHGEPELKRLGTSQQTLTTSKPPSSCSLALRATPHSEGCSPKNAWASVSF